VLTDWFKWAKGEETSDHHEDVPGWQKYFGVSLDHKVIGIQYTITAISIMGFGGIFALIFRTELAKSQLQFLTTTFRAFDQNGLQFYNTLMSLHGMLMIVSILLGVAGMMNYLVPLLLGAKDMAWAALTPAGPVILRFRRVRPWASRCSSWVYLWRVGLLFWVRSTCLPRLFVCAPRA
jgi:cytochrome c oxidase subunit 1